MGNITLDKDQQAVIDSEISKSILALQTLRTSASSNTVDEHYAKTLLNVLHYNGAEIAKQLGLETIDTVEVEERHKKMRQLNERIQELEDQLGQGITSVGAKNHLEKLFDALTHFWKKTGIGSYTGSPTLQQFGGMDAKLNIDIGGSPVSSMFEDKPISAKEKRKLIAAKIAEEYDVIGDPHGSRQALQMLDNDHNRAKLTELISNALPSAFICSFDNHNQNGQFTLYSISIFIRNIEDLDAFVTNEDDKE